MGSFSGSYTWNCYSEVPILVQWMATLKCGLSCEHCLAAESDYGFSDMPLSDAIELIDEIVDMGVKEFLITGGEPLARNDLPEIVEYLGCRRQNWTLNTSGLPSRDQRRVIADNPPGFVAISLDGPREVHDTFRGREGAWEETMESIRFFRSLPGVRTCAGTTVTSYNYRFLEETFHLVAASGVDQWGIHLLVPEGRAACRPDLFLSRRQLKRLIGFVTRKRNYFKVELADEIGYLGSFEPLVRDFPLTCGAGRSQCVILPDGEVVPCTTLDRSFSAGNIHQRSLREIWAEGFGELRAHEPEGKCSDCIYLPACGSGCWLQRKNGKGCFREIWHIPDLLKTAAGITVCLGAMAAGQSSGTEYRTTGSPSADSDGVLFDEMIMDIYTETSAGFKPGELYSSFENIDRDDPAWDILAGFRNGTLPLNIDDRCELVLRALDTDSPSLSLAALLWRVLNEPILEGSSFSESERDSVFEVILALREKTFEWRFDVFENRLDPYISSERFAYRPFFMYSKAGPRPGEMERYSLSLELNIERWGTDTSEITAEYLLEHPFAEHMNLTFTSSSGAAILNHSGGGSESLISDSSGRYTAGIFDVIECDEDDVLSFEISGTAGSEKPFGYESPDESENLISVIVEVSVDGGREYAYTELLMSAYHQQSDRILETAIRMLSEPQDWYGIDYQSVETIENEALLWPAVREIADTTEKVSSVIRRHSDIDDLRRRALRKDIDFWMF